MLTILPSMLSTFFILRSKQGSGLGNKVMDYMETMARDHLGVRTLTLTTPPASSLRGDEMRVKRGMEPLIEPASKFVPGEWYTRRGYETYKTQPYYTWVTKEGEAFLAPAVVSGLAPTIKGLDTDARMPSSCGRT